MNQLPKHIADMCGVVIAKTQSQAPAEEFQAVKQEIDADDVIQITYRDSVVGWINDTKSEHWPPYHALTANGRINRFYTQSEAMNWLIEEAF